MGQRTNNAELVVYQTKRTPNKAGCCCPSKVTPTISPVSSSVTPAKTNPRVTELCHQLKESGYYPWLDKEDLLPGQSWRREIRKIISDPYNLVVVCLSSRSTSKRGVVQQEITWALDVLDRMPEDTIYLIPARLEPCSVPDRLLDLHWVDLFEPNGFEILKRAIDFEISKRQAEFEPQKTASLGPPVPARQNPR